MKVSVELPTMFRGLAAIILLVARALVLPEIPGDGWAVAYAADAETLPAAQTRLRYSQEELDSAQSEMRRQEQRLKEAEESLARQQKRVEEEQAKVERSKAALTDAKARVAQAKEKHDQAYADIQRLYRGRQQPPSQ